MPGQAPADTATLQRTATGLPLWLLAVLGAVFTALFWPTLSALHARWVILDGPYSHGYLVVGMVGYFLWLERDVLARVPVRPAPLWLLPLAGASLLWGLAQLIDVQVVGMLLLPFLLLTAVAALLGTRMARIVAFPVLLLLISVPIWEDLFGMPLRQLTVVMTSLFIDWFAPFPAHIDGYTITIPEGAFFVANGCSGMSFFLTGITIALAYGHLNITGFARRALFVLVCVAISMLSNWIRVASLVFIGHWTRMQSTLITEGHGFYGWCLFAVAMAVMLAIGYRLSAPLPAAPAAGPGDDAGNADTGAAPSSPETAATREHASIRGAALLPMLLVLALGPALGFGFRALDLPARAAPPLPAAFTEHDAESAPWRPNYHGATSLQTAEWNEDARVQLTLVHYAHQSQSAELVSDRNNFAAEDGWNVRQLGRVEGGPHAMQETVLSAHGGPTLIIWSWNLMGGHPTIGRIDSKLAQLRAAVLDRRPDATLVALSSYCASDCESERAALARAAAVAMPAIDGALQGPAQAAARSTVEGD